VFFSSGTGSLSNTADQPASITVTDVGPS
jgi:hypothetical protein